MALGCHKKWQMQHIWCKCCRSPLKLMGMQAFVCIVQQVGYLTWVSRGSRVCMYVVYAGAVVARVFCPHKLPHSHLCGRWVNSFIFKLKRITQRESRKANIILLPVGHCMSGWEFCAKTFMLHAQLTACLKPASECRVLASWPGVSTPVSANELNELTKAAWALTNYMRLQLCTHSHMHM